MRPGEIVRIPDGFADIGRAYPTGAGDAGVSANGRDRGCWPVDLLEIVTVAELFEAAGHPVPESAVLIVHGFNWWAYGDTGNYRFGNSGWLDRGDVHQIKNVDLSRLPALDAWDALPEVIKAVVK